MNIPTVHFNALSVEFPPDADNAANNARVDALALIKERDPRILAFLLPDEVVTRALRSLGVRRNLLTPRHELRSAIALFMLGVAKRVEVSLTATFVSVTADGDMLAIAANRKAAAEAVAEMCDEVEFFSRWNAILNTLEKGGVTVPNEARHTRGLTWVAETAAA